MKRANLDLHIDELVLSGIHDVSPASVGASIESELARLFSQHGIPRAMAQAKSVSSSPVTAFERSAGAGAGSLGLQIAHSVYGVLKR